MNSKKLSSKKKLPFVANSRTVTTVSINFNSKILFWKKKNYRNIERAWNPLKIALDRNKKKKTIETVIV